MKTSDSSRVVGGSSLWGGFFDVLLERYGWTFDYLLWGISYTNTQMLLSDSIQTFIISEKDKSSKGTKISGDDVSNNELIKSLIRD